MSYILEALKKLEERREQEEQPKLLMFSREPGPTQKKRVAWPYILAGALLLNSLVMIRWINPWQTDKGSPPAGPTGSARRPWLTAGQIGWAFGFGYFLIGLHWIAYAFLVDMKAHLWLLPFAAVLMPSGLAFFFALPASSNVRMALMVMPCRPMILPTSCGSSRSS